ETLDNKTLIESAIKAAIGKDLKITFILTEPAANQARRRSGYSEADGMDIPDEDGDSSGKEVDPIVKAALEIFGGDMTDASQNRGRIG
ncbi:MAG: hypothetical protein WCY36_08195, partial [Candidatus Omnitrophota bacterium]